jgi:hypothetical protein
LLHAEGFLKAKFGNGGAEEGVIAIFKFSLDKAKSFGLEIVSYMAVLILPGVRISEILLSVMVSPTFV